MHVFAKYLYKGNIRLKIEHFFGLNIGLMMNLDLLLAYFTVPSKNLQRVGLQKTSKMGLIHMSMS